MFSKYESMVVLRNSVLSLHTSFLKMPVKLPHDKKYSKKNVYSYRILKQYIIIFFSYDLTYVAIAPFTILYTQEYKSN